MRLYLAFFSLLLGTLPCIASAQSRVALRDLNTTCPFEVPADAQAWQARATNLRLQLSTSLGLFPNLDLPTVEPIVYGRIARKGYTIERIVFDSLPGLAVTGSLYKPADMEPDAKIPGILCPHGHWDNARFRVAPDAEVRRALASGAERFEAAARNHIQARCVQLARMGCVVLQWDMLGYCDSGQISRQRAHGFKSQASEIESNEGGYLLYSPQAESHFQSTLSLQALATQRATDALLSLNFVDADRIAITGASGGGTQAFLGAALDPRIAVAFPAVMVSTGMQGGCTCENCSLLRVGTGNVEIAALIAPRPLGLTAANDWTQTMPEDGFPQLQSLYSLLGVADNVQLFPSLHFEHNFNHVSRVSMYGWMNQHLHLGLDEPILESDFQLAGADDLSVWNTGHPAPKGGLEFERQLLRDWSRRVDARFSELQLPARKAELSQTLVSGWRACLGLTALPIAKVRSVQITVGGDLRLDSTDGSSWSLTSSTQPATLGVNVTRTTEAGPQTLHFTGLGEKPQQLVDNPRLAAAYTYGYNLPQFAKKARQLAQSLDILSQKVPTDIRLTASGPDAALAAAAVFCWQQTFPTNAGVTLELSPNAFQFSEAQSIRSPSFLPGSAKFRDLDGLLASLQNAAISLDRPESKFPLACHLASLRSLQIEFLPQKK